MKIPSLVLTGLLLAAGFAGCLTTEPAKQNTGNPGTTGGPNSGLTNERLTADLTGSGSTFIQPLMTAWTTEYNQLQPGVKAAYGGGGSGQGIKQITEKTTDFGATDAPMKDEELAKAPGILHIPASLGGVAVIYNLPGLAAPLKLDAATVADIFEARVTRWNDPKITAQNPGVSLPDNPITVVVRSDGSGTTDTFTTYLAQAAASTWTLGKGKTVSWPASVQQAKGNDGVGSTVKNNPYTVGYAGSEWAFVQEIQMAHLKNKAGKYVAPTIAAISAGANEGVGTLAADTRGTLVDPPGDASYPIVALVWLLAYKEQADEAKGKALVDFLWYATHEGQELADRDPLTYAPLPPALVQKGEQMIKSITYAGKPIKA
ncbi:MAG TPA: phosphate ABC transporter substrate-binding protein PstS [Candidatus Thermoplasmatota archaeon]|nr:phosphate ABC transporter substrate-binding protein PstS [Candidatus Thermoplasmatota archaeon]